MRRIHPETRNGMVLQRIREEHPTKIRKEQNHKTENQLDKD